MQQGHTMGVTSMLQLIYVLWTVFIMPKTILESLKYLKRL